MKLAALAFAATLGLAGIASAQPAGPGPVGPTRPPVAAAGPVDRPAAQPRGELRQLLLERFDRDRDGRLDAQERRHAIRALRRIARRMAMQDRRAGAAGAPRADAGARREARIRALVQRFDRNGDGWLDDRDARVPRDRDHRDRGRDE